MKMTHLKLHDNDASEIARCLDLMCFLVAVIDASEYFALSGLCRTMEESAKRLMRWHDRFALLFMAVCVPDCDVSKVLRDTALGLVKKRLRLFIRGTKSIVAMIHPMYVEEILKQERLPMNKKSCFQILQAWAAAKEEKVRMAMATKPKIQTATATF
jgi:hypothetical protein